MLACGVRKSAPSVRGDEEESPSGLSGIAYAAGGQEASTAGLLPITAAQGAVPRLGNPPLPRVQPPFSKGSVVQYRITPLPFRITGKFTKLVSLRRKKYALCQKCSGACQTFQLRRGKGCSGRVLDLALTPRCAPIATTES